MVCTCQIQCPLNANLSNAVASCSKQNGIVTGSAILHLFVTFCFSQDGGATWSTSVCHIILQARWRHHVVCICSLHIVGGKMTAPRGLHLFVTYCCRQDGGATRSVFVCHILLQTRWRRHLVCISLSYVYCCKQNDGAKWSICTIVHVKYSILAVIISRLQ